MILNPYLLHILTFLSYIHNALSNSLFFLLCSSVPPTGACELACNGLIDPLHWLAGSEVTSATKTRATLHTSCLVVSSHHYTTNILSHTVISTSTLRSRNPPPSRSSNIQVYSNRFLREDPLVVASAATQEVGETVSYQKVIKRRRVPRATAKILHADRTLDFLVNPPSSCAQFHIYPRVAVPVRHSTILYNPFFCSATQHRPLAAESPCLSRCSGDR